MMIETAEQPTPYDGINSNDPLERLKTIQKLIQQI